MKPNSDSTDLDEVFRGRNFVVRQEKVELPGGLVELHEHVWRTDGARIVAVDDRGRVLLTREFRHELGERDWRIPGGKVDPTEDPEQTAGRELQEETGYQAARLKFLWSTTPDSTVRYRRHFFIATDLTEVGAAHDPGESMTIHWMSLDEACEKALAGEVREEISALALLRIRHGGLTQGPEGDS